MITGWVLDSEGAFYDVGTGAHAHDYVDLVRKLLFVDGHPLVFYYRRGRGETAPEATSPTIVFGRGRDARVLGQMVFTHLAIPFGPTIGPKSTFEDMLIERKSGPRGFVLREYDPFAAENGGHSAKGYPARPSNVRESSVRGDFVRMAGGKSKVAVFMVSLTAEGEVLEAVSASYPDVARMAFWKWESARKAGLAAGRSR